MRYYMQLCNICLGNYNRIIYTCLFTIPRLLVKGDQIRSLHVKRWWKYCIFLYLQEYQGNF